MFGARWLRLGLRTPATWTARHHRPRCTLSHSLRDDLTRTWPLSRGSLGGNMPSSIEVHTQCRRHGRSSRPGRSVSTVRYTLMAPPSRLSVDRRHHSCACRIGFCATKSSGWHRGHRRFSPRVRLGRGRPEHDDAPRAGEAATRRGRRSGLRHQPRLHLQPDSERGEFPRPIALTRNCVRWCIPKCRYGYWPALLPLARQGPMRPCAPTNADDLRICR